MGGHYVQRQPWSNNIRLCLKTKTMMTKKSKGWRYSLLVECWSTQVRLSTPQKKKNSTKVFRAKTFFSLSLPKLKSKEGHDILTSCSETNIRP